MLTYGRWPKRKFCWTTLQRVERSLIGERTTTECFLFVKSPYSVKLWLLHSSHNSNSTKKNATAPINHRSDFRLMRVIHGTVTVGTIILSTSRAFPTRMTTFSSQFGREWRQSLVVFSIFKHQLFGETFCQACRHTQTHVMHWGRVHDEGCNQRTTNMNTATKKATI